MKKFYFLLLCLAMGIGQQAFCATESASPITLFYTDFTEGTEVTTPTNQWAVIPTGHYVNPTNPSSSQFTCASAGRQSSSYLRLSPTTKLTSFSAGTGFAFTMTRNVDLAATAPQAIKIEFHGTVSSGSSGSSPKFYFQVGSGFANEVSGYSAIPTKPGDALVHSGFGIRYNSSTTMQIYQNNGSTTMSAVLTCASYQNMVWTMVINNCGETLTYTAPTGSSETLANDTYDLWIGTTKMGNDIPATTGTQTLNQFKFGEYNTNGRGNYTINWFSIKDILGEEPPQEPTITLTSDASTANQTVTEGTAIEDIEYTWGGAATGANVTWSDTNGPMDNPPTGIFVDNTENPVVISGTPTVPGIYTYTITTTGGVGSDSDEGTITVEEEEPPQEPTITLTSDASTADQTVTEGTAIEDIEYTWGGTATGAYVTWSDTNGPMASPPTGISVDNTKNPVVISGTPTVPGIYTYTTTTTGGVGSDSDGGTITVEAQCIVPDSKTVYASAVSICEEDEVSVILENPQTGVTYALFANQDTSPLAITPTGTTELTWVVSPVENTIYTVKSVEENGFCTDTIGSTEEIIIKYPINIVQQPAASTIYIIDGPAPTLSINAAGGDTLIYTWYQSMDKYNNTPADDIEMQSDTIKTFTPDTEILAEIDSTYYFYCIVSGSECGSDQVSNIAEITVSETSIPTYYWIGGTGPTVFTTRTNWSSELGGTAVASLTTAELAEGRFIFDGTNIGGGATGNITTSLTNNSSIGKLDLRNGAHVTFAQSSTTTFNILIQNDDALRIDGTSVLSTTGSAFTFNLYAGIVFGELNFGSGSSNGSILPTKEDGLIFENGSVFSYNFSSTGSTSACPFALGSTTVAVFKSGSTAKIIKGFNIFGNYGDTRVRFEKGSTFLIAMTTSSNGSVVFDGYAYSNIVYDAPIAFQSINGGTTGDGGIICDDFIVKADRSITVREQGTSQIKGNLTVESGATLNFTVATSGSIGTFYFNGQTLQTITNLGTINIANTNRAAFVIDNAAGVKLGSALNLNGSGSAPFTVGENSTFDMGSYAITSRGTFTTQEDATLKTSSETGINGNIGNISGTITLHDANNYVFYGNTAQETGLLIPNSVSNLILENTVNVTLSKSVTINDTLIMGNCNFILNNYNLTLKNPVSGTTSVNSHIVTNGLGSVLYICPNSISAIFPVGYDANNYNPISITNNAGENQTYSVRALYSTLDNGIKAMWSIGGATLPSSTLNISWTSDDIKENATITNNGLIAMYNGTRWEKQVSSILAPYNTTLENILLDNPTNYWTISELLQLYRSKYDGSFNDMLWQTSNDNINWTDSSEGLPQESLVDKIIISTNKSLNVEQSSYLTNELVIEPGAQLHITTGSLHVEKTLVLQDVDNDHLGEIIQTTESETPAFTINGVVKIHKYFSKGMWYYISMPFEVEKITSPDGTQLVASINGNTANYYLKYFDGQQRADTKQANVGSSGTNWKYFSDGYSYTTMQPNIGYIFAVGSNRDVVFVSKPNTESSDDLADIVKMEEKSVATELFESEDEKHSGWNFIGNPYATRFNLNSISPQYVYYVYNYVNKNYDTYFMNDYDIRPCQPFFLQTTSESIEFQPGEISLRSLNPTPNIEEIRLQFSNSSYSDIFRVHLRDDATTGYDINKDGQKIFDNNTTVPQLFSYYNGTNLAIVALPNINNESIIIPLSYFVPVAGTYNISFSENESSPNIIKLLLRNKTDNSEYDLLTNSYNFSSTKKETVNNRYELEIRLSESGIPTNIHKNDNGIKLTQRKNQVILHGLDSQSQVCLYDMTGRKVANFQNINNNEPINVNFKGLYIITVNNKTQSVTEKIIFR